MSSTESTVRLIEIHVEGYRSCRHTNFFPHAELSALIGINGAGKTNLLNAIRLLGAQQRFTNYRKAEIEKASSETLITATFKVGEVKVGLKVRLLLGTSSRNSDQVMGMSEQWNFHSITGSRAWKNIPGVFYSQEGRKLIRYKEDGIVLKSMKMAPEMMDRLGPEFFALDAKLLSNEVVIDSLQAISEFRAGISHYSASQFTDPTRCPTSFEIDEDNHLSQSYGDSKAHIKFIYDLYRLKTTQPEQYTEFCNFVSRKQLGLVSRIVWKEIELSSNTAEVKSGGPIKKIRKTKTLVIPKIQISSSYITFNQLSEGTFKTLALVFYVMTDASSCLLIEEPEVCVHHGLLNRIISTIKAYSKTKQVIFSTHSDLLVDDLEPRNVFVVEMDKSGTKATALEDWVDKGGAAALHSYLQETGSLGEYWRSGGLS